MKTRSILQYCDFLDVRSGSPFVQPGAVLAVDGVFGREIVEDSRMSHEIRLSPADNGWIVNVDAGDSALAFGLPV